MSMSLNQCSDKFTRTHDQSLSLLKKITMIIRSAPKQQEKLLDCVASQVAGLSASSIYRLLTSHNPNLLYFCLPNVKGNVTGSQEQQIIFCSTECIVIGMALQEYL